MGIRLKIQSKEYDEYFLSRENSIITDLFYTQLIIIFTCHCGKETYSFQKLIDIPLLIPNDKKTIDIYSLLEKFLSEIKVKRNSLFLTGNMIFCNLSVMFL